MAKKLMPLTSYSHTHEEKITSYLDDLIVSMKILYDTTIPTKLIGATIEAKDPESKEYDRLREQYFPDAYFSRKMIGGSRFGATMTECLMIIIQIASGCKVVKNSNDGIIYTTEEFYYPDEIKSFGIVPLSKIESYDPVAER